MTRRYKYVVVLGVFVGICMMKLLHIPCLFRMLWEIPCPGCGMTRAWTSLVRLRWQEAFASHPLFWLVPIMLVVWLRTEQINWQFYVFWGSVVSLFIGVYLVRMIGGMI